MQANYVESSKVAPISDNKNIKLLACKPIELNHLGFNPQVILPYGCTTKDIERAMQDYLSFLGFINQQLHSRGLPRLESFLMPANFSSIVGEFMAMTIPKYCKELVRNRYHNGHPDLLLANEYENDAAKYADKGIEIKASRRVSRWHGHNPESIWLMVFVFDSNSSSAKDKTPKPFKFIKVIGALLDKEDWNYSGRSETSRRTITASVNRKGFEKMEQNWIYRELLQQKD